MGNALVTHPDIGAIGFTGSYNVDRQIPGNAGVKKVLLELDDTGPMIVLKDALDKGADLLTGGKRENLFYEPTVLDNVTQDMIIAREETFGPVATIIRVKDKDEALEIANSNNYGLEATVFTSNLRDAYIMSEEMKFGAVIVNDTTNHWDQLSPFGGVKGSGIGRECSQFGMEEFTDIKKIVVNIGNVKR